jgi:hypothetical protein
VRTGADFARSAEATVVSPKRAVLVSAILGLLVLLVGGGFAAWQLALNPGSSAQRGRPSSALAVTPRTLTLHVIGWGTPIHGYTGHGSCPDGQFEAPIESAARKVGSFVACALADSKVDKPNWGVRSTHAVLIGTYTLRDGTIVTREQRTFLFSRQSLNSAIPIRTRGYFTGRIVGGSGDYAHLGGTINGGGLSVNNNGNWTVEFHFR